MYQYFLQNPKRCLATPVSSIEGAKAKLIPSGLRTQELPLGERAANQLSQSESNHRLCPWLVLPPGRRVPYDDRERHCWWFLSFCQPQASKYGRWEFVFRGSANKRSTKKRVKLETDKPSTAFWFVMVTFILLRVTLLKCVRFTFTGDSTNVENVWMSRIKTI